MKPKFSKTLLSLPLVLVCSLASAGTYSIVSLDTSLVVGGGDWTVTKSGLSFTYAVNDTCTNYTPPPPPPGVSGTTVTKFGGAAQGTAYWHLKYTSTGAGDVPTLTHVTLTGTGHCGAYASMPPIDGDDISGNSTTTFTGDIFVTGFQLTVTSEGSQTNTGYSTTNHTLGTESYPIGTWTEDGSGNYEALVAVSVNSSDNFSEFDATCWETMGGVNFSDTLSITL